MPDCAVRRIANEYTAVVVPVGARDRCETKLDVKHAVAHFPIISQHLVSAIAVANQNLPRRIRMPLGTAQRVGRRDSHPRPSFQITGGLDVRPAMWVRLERALAFRLSGASLMEHQCS